MPYNNELKEILKSKVYNALSNAAYEVFESKCSKYSNISEEEQKKMMEEAVEWFMIHFFEQ